MLRVLRSPGGVTIADTHALHANHTFDAVRARELVELLDTALNADAPHGLVGSVPTTSGRVLHVLRWPAAVTISDHPEPRAHSGWTLRMRDQVEALRDAIAGAAGADAPSRQVAGQHV
jgi:hypothetical protein